MNRADISAVAKNERDLKDGTITAKQHKGRLLKILERQPAAEIKKLALSAYDRPVFAGIARRALYNRVRAEICGAATKGTP